jgi:hypothetical protein
VLRTPKQTGERIGISSITVLRLFDAGALAGVVVHAGKRKRIVRFRDEAIERFIASRERGGKYE